MKWEVVISTTKQELFELWHDDKKLLSLDFHPGTNSARVQYAGEKRVFLIRREGFLRNKTVLRNEYGIRIGQLSHEKSNADEGIIELNDEKFFYEVRKNPLAELVIYRSVKIKPFVVCGLKPGSGNTFIQFSKANTFSTTQHFLLMALCWYMFQPVAKQNTLEYA